MTRLLIFGSTGMVGSALVSEASASDKYEVVAASRKDVDLTDSQATFSYLQEVRPEVVIMPAAKVGGIIANDSYPVDFLFENISIAMNTIRGCHLSGVRTLLFMGSSCIYPKLCAQPIAEESLLTGSLEPTNEPYAIAKIAGLKACEAYNRQYRTDFRGIMPTNLYGLNDNYDPNLSHVIPGLIQRMHYAKTEGAKRVVVWGSGRPLREFLNSSDLARACLKIVETSSEEYYKALPPNSTHVNIGAGEEVSIRELADLIAEAVGYEGEITFDHSKPDGAPRKSLDSSRIRSFDWSPRILLADGLKIAYNDFLSTLNNR